MNMYTHQQHLPRLPLPSLDQTSDKLLEWSGVFLSEKELRQTQYAVETFRSPEGVGPILQTHLKDLNSQPEIQNWLEPLWAESYLRNPAALPLGSNVAYLLDKPPGTKEMPLAEYLTSLIITLFDFNALILNETLGIDYQGKIPLCMSQYKTLFSSTRIPGESKDTYVMKPETSHIILIHRGHYYRLDVVDGNRQQVTPSHLLQQIIAILSTPKAVEALAIGSLTTLPRKEWAHLRNHLAEIHAENAFGLHQIETALAVFAVDEPHNLNESQLFKQLLMGESWNRWYDKSLQFILHETGEWGLNYEHSGVDGTTLGRMISFLFQKMAPLDYTAVGEAPTTVHEIPFMLDDYLKSAINKAAADIQKDADHLSLELLAFDTFGKNHIKGLGVSPDSFVQIGLQLAQKRAFNQVFNAYESVMTKQFLGGRTETMRPVTLESLAFVENPSFKRFKTASLKHVARITECKNGQGIDRHLYGLKKMHEKLYPEAPLPAVFSSPGYLAITTNSFSTSTSNVEGLRYAGYAPSLKDGFAFRYQFLPDRLHFFLSCHLHREEDLNRLKVSLVQSLNQMGSLANE